MGDGVRYSGDRNIAGPKIRQLRKAQGLNQAEMVRLLSQHGVTIKATALSKIEGMQRGISDIELIAFSKVFKVPLSKFF